MILYTTMPQELVFQTEENEFGKQKVVSHNGIPLLVEMMEGQDCRVLRVMSSDPLHYMDEKYTPGVKLTLL